MIPVSNPLENYLAHAGEIQTAIDRVLHSGSYILGKEVAAFEAEFAEFCQAKYAIGVNSGTDALIITMRALGLGGNISTIPMTALATVAAILAVGATPVITDNAKDILVHLYGARSRSGLIEDYAQAAGLRLRPITGIGCFSFYPTKNLGCIGDGGMIVTNDANVAEKCRYVRQYGWNEERLPQCIGINSRLDPIQAAILRVKLKYLDAEIERRREIAVTYNEAFADLPIECPLPRNHVFHLYVIECKNRDQLREHLFKNGIETAIHYPVPVHLQPYYRDKIIVKGPIKPSWRHVLSLPMYPELSDKQVKEVIDGVRSFF